MIIDRPGQDRLFIEIKSTEYFNSDDLTRYNQFLKDSRAKSIWFVTNDKIERNINQYKIIPWQLALEKIFEELNEN